MNSYQQNKSALVIVGNGMVAGRFLDELLKRDAKKFDITVIGAEPEGSYNRIMLSSVLAKDSSSAQIILKSPEWYQTKGIKFIGDTKVTHVDRQQKLVTTESGDIKHYDQLVLATGSRAAKIPAKNLELNNIFMFRTIADTHAIMAKAQTAKSVMVVGGGLLGLEAAYGLAKLGAKVVLVHRNQSLLNRQLDRSAAQLLEVTMQNMGIEFRLANEVTSFHGDTQVESATLTSGETVAVDMAVIATGITPNKELGVDCGLVGECAIAVDDYMQTCDPAISALGECIEHRGATFGLVDPLWRQAETLAARLAHNQRHAFTNQSIATKLKVSGVQVFSAGEVNLRNGLSEVRVEDAAAKIYRKLLIENGLIKGIVLFGDIRSGQYFFELMENRVNVAKALPNLIFGQEYVSQALIKTLAA